MDVSEIRAAFLLSETLSERIRRFRDERLSRIIADETPVRLRAGAKLVLHIVPVASFASNLNLDTTILGTHARNLEAIGGGGGDDRFNLDGFITYDRSQAVTTGSRTYCQIYRSGQIESVCADFVSGGGIASVAYEKDIIQAVLRNLGVLKALEVPCPLLIFLSMVGVSGARLLVSARRMDNHNAPIDRDTLILPDILVEDYASVPGKNQVARALRPVFDAVWNACGYARSFNFDEEGNWNPT